MPTPMEIQIDAALQAYENDAQLSIRRAASLHKVSEATLRRRLNHGLTMAESQAHKQLLSPAQERLFVHWIVTLEADGHAPTHATMREMAGLIARESGGKQTVGKHWLERFFNRHPEVHSKSAMRIDNDRATGANKDALTAFFEHFHRCMMTHKVNKENIWNMDETGTQLGASTHYKVGGTSKTHKTYKKAVKNREWVTAVETVSATGKHIPCLIIFKGNTLQTSWFPTAEIPDWRYCVSENAFTTNKLGCRWLEEIFLPQTTPATPGAPRILLLDNHGSHVTVDFMWKAYQNNVHLIYMPPHTSHVVQPLDLAIFSRIKASYKAQIEALARFEDSVPIKKIRFVKYYNQARLEALSEHIICSGWRAAGLVPWKPSKVLNSKQILENQALPTFSQKSPLKRPTSPSFVTPRNANEVKKLRYEFFSDKNDERTRRKLFTKIATFVEKIHVAEAHNKQEIATQGSRIDELLRKKAGKSTIDSNETFGDIESVKEAYDNAVKEAEEKARKVEETKARKKALAAKKAANPGKYEEAALKRASEQAQQLQIEFMCTQFHVDDVVDNK